MLSILTQSLTFLSRIELDDVAYDGPGILGENCGEINPIAYHHLTFPAEPSIRQGKEADESVVLTRPPQYSPVQLIEMGS